MRAVSMILVLSLLAMIGAGAALAQEMAKEGTMSGRFPYSGTFKTIALGPERFHMNYEVMGLSLEENKTSPSYNASYHCLGALQGVKGSYDNDTGFCVFVRPRRR